MKRGTAQAEARQEEILFIKRWLAHPLKVGALLPSSPFLARLVARHTRIGDDDVVVELGAGPGLTLAGLGKAFLGRTQVLVGGPGGVFRLGQGIAGQAPLAVGLGEGPQEA